MDQLTQGVFRPVTRMVSSSAVVLAIASLLFLINPIVALVVGAILGCIYAVIYTQVRGYLWRLGGVRSEANTDRFRAAGEVFGGIKSIKLQHCEQAYLSRFSILSSKLARAQARSQTLLQVPHYLVEVVAFGGILLLTLGLLAFHGGAQGGALGEILAILGVYALATYRLAPAAQNIYQGLASMRFGGPALANIHRDLHDGRVNRVGSVDARLRSGGDLEFGQRVLAHGADLFFDADVGGDAPEVA